MPTTKKISPNFAIGTPQLPCSGFTLVELLVVISIIAVLLLLTVQVLGALVGSARQSATQVTIRKVSRMLDDRAEAFHRLTSRSGHVEATPEYRATQELRDASNLPLPKQLRKTLAKKLLYRKLFPQRRQELIDAQLIATADPQPNITAIATTDPVSSGDILYDFLTNSSVVGGSPDGSDAFSTAEVRDTNGNGLSEFIDAWGNPLRFYRWPTRLFRPSGTVVQANPGANIDLANVRVLFSTFLSFSGNLQNDLARDPDDPLRTLANAQNYQGTNTLETLGLPAGVIRPAITAPIFHTAATFHTLFVVSAGPDGVLGLYEPEDTINDGHLAKPDPSKLDNLLDDITYLNVRAGGR